MLIATDLDGTLVPDGATTLSARTATALGRADEAGIPVVFVTARPLRWMDPFWPYVGSHGMAIVSNGAATWDVADDSAVSVSGIQPALGLDICEMVTEAEPTATFAIECIDGFHCDGNFVEPYPVQIGSRRGPMDEIWIDAALKLMIRNRTGVHGWDVFRERVIDAVGDLGTTTWSVPGFVEVSAPGVNKAAALEQLCRDRGVDQGDVVAFGDMPNDIPMLSWAGTSYAMAGAHELVRSASHAIAPACEDDGVARVIEMLLRREHGQSDARPGV